jgi:hypothetical protein
MFVGLRDDIDIEHLLDLHRRSGLHDAVTETPQAQIRQRTAPEVVPAVFNLAASCGTTKTLRESDTRKNIMNHKQKEYSGMVLILLMESLIAVPCVSANDESDLQDCRRNLQEDWPSIVRYFSLDKTNSFLKLKLHGVDLLECHRPPPSIFDSPRTIFSKL